MSAASRQIVLNLTDDLIDLLGQDFYKVLSNVASSKAETGATGIFSAPPLPRMTQTLQLSLETVSFGKAGSMAWNPVVVAYHNALIAALKVIESHAKCDSISSSKQIQKNVPKRDSSKNQMQADQGKVNAPSTKGIDTGANTYSARTKTGLGVCASPQRSCQQTPGSQKGSMSARSATNQPTFEKRTIPRHDPSHLDELHDLWLDYQFPIYNNSKIVKCEESKCAFCHAMFKHVTLTKCSEFRSQHRSGPCTTSGWFPHVGPGLWGKIKKAHSRGDSYTVPDTPVEGSLAAIELTKTPVKRKLRTSTPSSPSKTARSTPNTDLEDGELLDSRSLVLSPISRHGSTEPHTNWSSDIEDDPCDEELITESIDD